MNKKCPNCKLANFADAEKCVRCGETLAKTANIPSKGLFHNSPILRRVVVCIFVLLFVLAGFYASLVFSADRLTYDERQAVNAAVEVLKNKGFADEVFYLERLAVFRANDNWLNASVEKENAYAATNFPFEIVTIYPDFFKYPQDDVERSAILLHESKHLQGKDEREAYEFVWKNRAKLGWTSDKYKASPVYLAVLKQTTEAVPSLFVCDVNPNRDCTETSPGN